MSGITDAELAGGLANVLSRQTEMVRALAFAQTDEIGDQLGLGHIDWLPKGS